MKFPGDQLVHRLSQVSHIIIKVGTGILTPHIDSPENYFSILANEVAAIIKTGRKAIIVTSGAVGYGRRMYSASGDDIVSRQALASLGQGLLIETWRKSFEKQGLKAAQILLTRADFNHQTHFNNMRNTLDRLLEWNCVPIINENDAVAIAELKLGDNDTLSAAIAALYSRSLLILLTTAPGYLENQRLIPFLSEVGETQMKHAGGAAAGGTGGMRTKMVAARKILQAGQMMNISSGTDASIIQRIMRAESVGTWVFDPDTYSTLSARKRWLLHNKHPRAKLILDNGAVQALRSKPVSLLSVGIDSVVGNFSKGDAVELLDQQKTPFARGIAQIDSFQLQKLVSSEDRPRGLEVVHRDNLVLLQDQDY